MSDGALPPGEGDDAAREWRLYRESMDPIARQILAAEGPWQAYEEAHSFSGVLTDHLSWLPHGGSVYVPRDRPCPAPANGLRMADQAFGA